jgi:hypothetical protein
MKWNEIDNATKADIKARCNVIKNILKEYCPSSVDADVAYHKLNDVLVFDPFVFTLDEEMRKLRNEMLAK